MPRKVKTEKPPLQFLERSLCGARVPNAPEVRAALNPKDFFTDRPDPDATTLRSWVSPQFETSAAAAAPARRGRGRCQSSTSILLSRNSVCKFPSLTFKSRLNHQPHRAQSTRKTAAHNSDLPKRPEASVRRGNTARRCDGAAFSRRGLSQPEAASDAVEHRGRTPATPASAQFSSLGPPPNVDGPDIIQKGRKRPSPSPLHMLLRRPCSPCNQPPELLVADTPEKDYGLKATWRRRKDLMTMMTERGHLSDSDVLIHSSFTELAPPGGSSDI